MTDVPTMTRADEGRSITFVDPTGRPRPALITRVWGPQCVNVVIVQLDENQEDNYGRKIERFTSVSHESIVQAHGNFWRL